MIKNREHVWLLLLGALFLLTISAAFGQDQKYAREQEKRIKGYDLTIKDLKKNVAKSEVNKLYLLTLTLDEAICYRHMNAYLNGEDRKELDRAINQLSRDMENVPPGFRTEKQ